jgi:hypothetical protein
MMTRLWIATRRERVYSPVVRTGDVFPPDIFPFVLRTAIHDVRKVAFAGEVIELSEVYVVCRKIEFAVSCSFGMCGVELCYMGARADYGRRYLCIAGINKSRWF